jgi:NAD(P)-dependent dehydrogenase (short-subunit alcohol dehydrogenase family)
MGHFLFSPSHGISLDDLEARKQYDPWARYGESKLANILHAKEITRRYGQSGVVGVAVHPGAILETDLKRHFGCSVVCGILWRLLISPKALGVMLSSANKDTAQVTESPDHKKRPTPLNSSSGLNDIFPLSRLFPDLYCLGCRV